MDFWPEFLASSWGREFVAGGFGGMAGIISGYPLDTLRLRQQSSNSGSALSILRSVVATEGSVALYRGMGAPLASVTFQVDLLENSIAFKWNTYQDRTDEKFITRGKLIQLGFDTTCERIEFLGNALVFQIYAVLSQALGFSVSVDNPPSFKSFALGGVGTGAIQSILLSPVELVKIRLQLQNRGPIPHHPSTSSQRGPISVAKSIWRTEGLRGIYRGFTITVLRDVPAYGFYFWTYEYTREKLHPGCRKRGDESLRTMLVAGGLAGVASWVSCYPLDVLKTRLQAQSASSPQKYNGIADCLCKSVKQDGYGVLWRGLGAAVARAFVVNGAVFAAYETTLRCLFNNGSI